MVIILARNPLSRTDCSLPKKKICAQDKNGRMLLLIIFLLFIILNIFLSYFHVKVII